MKCPAQRRQRLQIASLAVLGVLGPLLAGSVSGASEGLEPHRTAVLAALPAILPWKGVGLGPGFRLLFSDPPRQRVLQSVPGCGSGIDGPYRIRE